MLFNQIQFF